jgi:hypothetical protein
MVRKEIDNWRQESRQWQQQIKEELEHIRMLINLGIKENETRIDDEVEY